MRLYLLNYKNYYNRRAKKLDTVADYAYYCVGDSTYLSGIDFWENDGIDTYQVIGTAAAPWTFGTPDYLLVATEQGAISSRWYVMECEKTRKFQYKLKLRRDVFADFYDSIMYSPALIERAMAPITSNAIFNPEGNFYNQIKTGEILLKDGTDCGWVVGYHTKIDSDKSISFTGTSGWQVSGTYGSFSDISFHDYIKVYEDGTKTVDTLSTKNIEYTMAKPTIVWNTRFEEDHSKRTTILDRVYCDSENVARADTIYSQGITIANTENKLKAAFGATDYLNLVNSSIDQTVGNAMREFNGNYYSVNGKIYLAKFVKVNYNRVYRPVELTAVRNQMTTDLAATGIFGTPQTDTFLIYGSFYSAYVEFTKVNPQAVTGGLTIHTTVKPLEDDAYYMWSIPYGGKLKINGTDYFMTKEQAIYIGTQIAKGLGNFNVDVQLLPYCPRRDFIVYTPGGNYIALGTGGYGQVGIDYEIIKDSDDATIGAIVYSKASKFNFSIINSISVPLDPIEFKIANETKFLRLVSPNYNGIYEFSATKNNGVKSFNIYCKYKPFNPYIHVQPLFGGLNGAPFDDARGLICSGDYSLTQISDAWINYQYNNKNYENSFNRGIQSQELRNNIARKYDYMNLIAGPLSGASGGAQTGAKVGGWGAAVGAVAGAGVNVLGTTMDFIVNETFRQDQISLAKDNFNYNVQNIQALPDSLTKVSAFSPVNKIFPFLEYYETTAEEEAELRKKIIARSMSINRIGTISEYINDSTQFITGKFIQIEDAEEDYHLLNTINNEFMQGVYI